MIKPNKLYQSLLLGMVFISCINCSPQVTTSTSSSPEQQLANQLTSGVLWYQQSAEMTASYLQAYHYAELMVGSKLDTMELTLPPAVVLDIDETVLDNSPYEVKLIEEGKQYSSESWKAWTEESRAEALPGALEFVEFAKSKGVEVFYISNRKEPELQSTIQNLQALNFPNADNNHVILRSGTSDKTERRSLVASDYTIILFIGDNLTDYSQLFADRGSDLGKDLVLENKEELLNNFIMLPNPMYGEWEGAIYGNNYSITTESKIEKRKKVMKK
ncbi:5'-nucleotidase, lipoprotein e(P4) family [Fulvivirga ligni]|uniref:5'-nucleotidase, lipoprotein e(P4) family n=1 Tax=Fulvivirga ligni TaxID=2904246 RepID=UPI001F47844A|nr:5'-nucleotidase, lipoprotein e(P4) family [Fulvivirga ligni]UII22513.1 5'-nucleotidase, lipoprotein e(P4) family [Fulvivirga ligni]